MPHKKVTESKFGLIELSDEDLQKQEMGKIAYVTYELLDVGKKLADKTMTESALNGNKSLRLRRTEVTQNLKT